jgi:hypothetical protein
MLRPIPGPTNKATLSIPQREPLGSSYVIPISIRDQRTGYIGRAPSRISDTREHHGAFERGHDLEGARLGIGAADPLREIVNATAEERQDRLGDVGRQHAGLGAKHTAEAHPPVALKPFSKGDAVGVDGVIGSLVRPLCHRCKEPVAIAASDSRCHGCLGGEVVMDARALDADFGGEIAKAETAISGVADIVLCEITNLSAVLSLTAPRRICLPVDRP